MLNPYNPKIAKIIKIKKQTPNTKLFAFRFVEKKDRDDFYFCHGQFMMAGLTGFGEAPFDICSNIFDTSVIELSIRGVGELTKAFNRLSVGDKVLLRGPYGHGFPDFKKFNKPNLLLIGGGCGFVMLKSIIEDYIKNYKDKIKAQILYGALDEENLIFKEYFADWRKYVDLQIILDKPKEPLNWKKGLITDLLKEAVLNYETSSPFLKRGQGGFKIPLTPLCERGEYKILNNATVIMCGPPAMYRFVIKELEKLNFSASDIYLSLERRMHCGIGVCHHCAIGSKLVCKEGPVFRYDEIKDIEGVC